MVCEKNKKICKDKFLITALVLISIGFMAFVLADHIVTTSTGETSYNLNEDVGFIYNITINNTDTDGANITTVNITLPNSFTFVGDVNDTDASYETFSNTTYVLSWTNSSGFIFPNVNNSFWFNATASTYGTYQINVTTYNSSGSFETLLTVTVNETSVAPEVSTPVYPVSYGNYSDSIIMNASINDSDSYGLIDTVIFMLTNSSGTQNSSMNYTASQQGSGLYWNATFDTSGFTDGVYNITVWANDTSGNLNNSEVIQSITFDNTHPTPSSLTKSSSSTKTSLIITFSGADGTCTSSRTGATISGSTLTETGLSCGTSYTYIITCVDVAGNSGSSVSTSFSTTSCGGGNVPSGTTSNFWTGTTHVVNEAQFKQGFTKQIKVKERMKIKVGTAYHHVGVKELTTTSATIEIASEPVEVRLDVGEDAKIDVDADDVYDIYVVLNSIVDDKADVTVRSISEEIPEGEGAVSTTGEDVTPTDDEDTTEDETSLIWLWILIVVVLVVVGFTIYKKQKQ